MRTASYGLPGTNVRVVILHSAAPQRNKAAATLLRQVDERHRRPTSNLSSVAWSPTQTVRGQVGTQPLLGTTSTIGLTSPSCEVPRPSAGVHYLLRAHAEVRRSEHATASTSTPVCLRHRQIPLPRARQVHPTVPEHSTPRKTETTTGSAHYHVKLLLWERE